MKKTILLFIVLFTFAGAQAQNSSKKSVGEAYQEKYAAYAVEEMHRSGIPASITLAQGMLESGYGRDELAVYANNHFGIQAHGKAWKGEIYKCMDSGELRDFRKYDSVLDSYADHSDFLLRNKRYSKLFTLKKTDYKGWARGLKKAGYAEASDYDKKLIDLIERYDLTRYDKITELPMQEREENKLSDNMPVPTDRKVVVVEVEREEPLTERQTRTYRYVLAREMHSQNGVPFIYAAGGETYSDIARQYDLFLREILTFNDVAADCELPAGAVVYLQAKKRKAAKGYERYIVEEGMGMMEISQKYAVKLKRLYKMNGLEESHVPEVGDTIILR